MGTGARGAKGRRARELRGRKGRRREGNVEKGREGKGKEKGEGRDCFFGIFFRRFFIVCERFCRGLGKLKTNF